MAKRTRVRAITAGTLLFCGAALAVFHLGPRMGFGEGTSVRAVCTLPDGSSLFLVQSRNSDLVEAYTMKLYRVGAGQRAERCLIGYEESYWWRPSIRLGQAGEVEIRADASALCTYDTDAHQLRWNDGKYPPQKAETAIADPVISVLRHSGHAPSAIAH